jgi:biopolymer transport protein ExbD
MSTLASPTAIKLLLPKATTGHTVPKHLINVSVTSEGGIFLDKQTIGLENLESLLTAEKLKNENATVVLRCDKGQTVEKLIQVVDAINKAKLPLVIATEKAK